MTGTYFEPINLAKRPMFQNVQEKPLRQILRIMRGMSASASKSVQWIPINLTQSGQSRLTRLALVVRRRYYQRPARRVELARVAY
jgi:hypothetical protein